MAEAARLYQVGEATVYALPSMEHDKRVRDKASYFIGAVAANAWNHSAFDYIDGAGSIYSESDVHTLSPPDATDEALTVRPIESLYDAIQQAAQGDETARKLIDINAFTDVIERTIKSGHITTIDMMADESGRLQQHGQSLESVQANTLRYAANNSQIRRRAEAEARNFFRLKECYDQFVLNDYYFVTFSRAADDMTDTAMARAGFFTDTMSCSIQATTSVGGKLVMESAFVAGTANPGAKRNDYQTIVKMCLDFGVDIEHKTATELLDTPLLLHKSLMPDGVINLVERYDKAAGGTFFGEDKPRQDYRQYRAQCLAREQTYQPKVDVIVAELIAEAPQITSRVMATERLNKISGKHMVEMAIQDAAIDSWVFGPQAAGRVELARWHNEQGNIEMARATTKEAVNFEESRSCPSGQNNTKSDGADGSNEATQAKDNKGNSAECEFVSKECPLCHKKNVKTTVTRKHGKTHIKGDCGCEK